jgi:hypothetical protein
LNASATVWRADCRLQPTRLELVLVVLAHALAAVVLLLVGGMPPLQTGLMLLVLAGLAGYRLQQMRRPGPASVVALRERDTDWWIETADGEGHRVRLLPQRLAWRWLLALEFESEGDAAATTPARPQRWRVSLLPGSIPADDFRRLRVRLRLQRQATAADLLDGGKDS